MVKEKSEREKSRTLWPRRASKETGGKACREQAFIGPAEPLKKHSAKSILRCPPIEGRRAKGPDSVVLFQNSRPAIPAKQQPGSSPKSRKTEEARETERLNREVVSTQNHLRSLLEDREAAIEELRAANEQIFSSNEELQKTNEELETAKEELQSSNQELTMLNEELQNRNIELSRTASDLNSLLNAVEIPIVILGDDRRLRRFTPAAAKLLNPIPSDVGRPISQILPNLALNDLDERHR